MSYPMDALSHGGGLRYKDGIAGEVLTARQVVYVAGDGRWYLSDADVPSSAPLIGLTVDPATTGQKCRILIKGLIHNSGWTWTPGQEIFLSQTAGGMTQTEPILPARTQVVGAAVTATIIWFEVEGASLGGGATGCALLEGATAYVGFDTCKEPFTNYFLVDGTADDEQIQAAIDYVIALGGGGIVRLESGLYDITATITMYGGIQLIGNGICSTPRATELILADNVDSDVILFNAGGGHTFFGSVRNMKINGNRANQASGNGITIPAGENVSDCQFVDLFISGVKEACINILDGYFNVINRCWLELSETGAYLDQSATISDSIISDLDTGIVLHRTSQRIINNWFDDCSVRAIYGQGGSYNHIIGNVFAHANDDVVQDILLLNANTYLITDNIHWETGGSFDYGVNITGSIVNSVITDNVYINPDTDGINMNAAGDVKISGNVGFNPVGIIANPFDTPNTVIELNGTAAVPTASTDYTVEHCDITISSTDSGNTDCAILLKDPAGNTVLQAALSTIEYMYVPEGFILNWGAFTGAAPTVTIAFN